jgi:hypothetical protein
MNDSKLPASSHHHRGPISDEPNQRSVLYPILRHTVLKIVEGCQKTWIRIHLPPGSRSAFDLQIRATN